MYYHFDELGSTRKLTDKDGVVTDTYSYDAWGNTTHTGDTEQPYQYVGQLGYYSHYQDENLDLPQLGVRFYDALTGRFTQQDPVRDGRNWYIYGSDNPSVFVDPSGTEIRDSSACREDRNKCQKHAFDEFNKCFRKGCTVGGAYDVAICALGCLPTLVWGKKAYEICLALCGVVAGGAVAIDLASCSKVLDTRLDSCESAYDRCVKRAPY